MTPLAVRAATVVSALGAGLADHAAALRDARSGLAHRRFETAELDTWIGAVDGLESLAWPTGLATFDCRNHRLALRALTTDDFEAQVADAVRRHGPARVGVHLGTSTSGILQTEIAYRQRDPATGALPASLDYGGTHNTGALAQFVRARLGLAGPSLVVSTACSSSAKVFASAQRLIDLGIVDAMVVGGVDTLCMTTLYGFRSLELLSTDICRPWDAARRGLSLGEGAAFALLERADRGRAPLAWLLGCGESSDAHHMSSPQPEGAGAAAAMHAALDDAGLAPSDVQYVNLHGTGTPGNDAAEDIAVATVFGTKLACSSTKGATGHTLGAAGGVEAVLSILALQTGVAPAGLNRAEPDPALHCAYLDVPRPGALSVVASNSFGFGGSNACLVFGAAR
jgi:3-oxoacyl-[acyl-carrier-protein] synthase-1